MIRAAELDVAGIRRWIGRAEVVRDSISPRLAVELHATLGHQGAAPIKGQPAPLAVHWCLAPAAASADMLGPDGHPLRGDFLPPVPLPRRMWAGSSLRLQDRLLVGDAVERRSTVADVVLKEGRSGMLCFVEIDHETATERGIAVAERQTLVYRAMTSDGDASPPTPTAPAAPAESVGWHSDRIASTTLLFRYSALTFNGHRIHYDRDYARQVEGYAGLVVHGPLQATQLLEFASEIRDLAPASFAFRGLTPLFDDVPYRLCAQENGTQLRLWIETGLGVRTLEADAGW